MATGAVQQQLLNSWAAMGGPSEEDKAAFVEAAILQLEDDGDIAKEFIENVKRVADWANSVDAAFENVTRNFAYLVTKYGKDFGKLATFDEEWVGYNNRWVEYLQVTRDVASELAGILRRFEHVFIYMIMNIRTEQDRLDCIAELQQFIDEDHRSEEMKRNFWDLRRDILDFVDRFDAYILETGITLDEDASKPGIEIDKLVKEIYELDTKINEATVALATMMGECVTILGINIITSILGALQSERNEKSSELVKKQLALAEITRKQVALGQLKYDFDNLKPDITLICDKLGMFATIWASVKSQSIQFQNHLTIGMSVMSNSAFKKELQLARAICTPLREGLQIYATELIIREERNVGTEIA